MVKLVQEGDAFHRGVEAEIPGKELEDPDD